MGGIVMKCKEFQIGDWIQDENGFQWQIIGVGDDYAYATFEGNEGDPWEFDDKDDQPEGIPLTKEMLDANGFRYEIHYGQYHTRSIIGDYRCTSRMCVSVTWHESPEGLNVAYYIDCFNNNEHNGNSVTIQSNLYVHTLQHALRIVGLSEIADNFKV